MRTDIQTAGSVDGEQFPVPQNRESYPALDGLRACAVLMVFAQHYIQSAFAGAWQWGWAGVNVFFVLSGFLITGILFDTRHSKHRFRNFYIRRTLRIFPLFYGLFLVLALSTPLLHWQWSAAWIAWPLYAGNYLRVFNQAVGSGLLASSLTLFQHRFFILLGHFWSLAIEEQFYLVFPCVVFAIKGRVRLRNLCLAAIVAVPALRALSVWLAPGWSSDPMVFQVATPFQLDSLLSGAALALAIRGEERYRLKKVVCWLAPVCSLLLIVIPLAADARPGLASLESHWIPTFGYTVIDLLSACVIWVAIQPGTPIFQILTLEPLRRLGQISYGFYVFHDIPHLLFVLLALRIIGEPGGPAYMLAAAIAFVSTIILSILSFVLYESPFLRLKDRLAPSQTRSVRPATVLIAHGETDSNGHI